MGGAADLPQRSSSPLKRRASDLETDASSSQKDDVDMVQVPPSDPTEVDELSISSRTRTHSVDALANGVEVNVAALPAAEQQISPARRSTDIPPIESQITTITTLIKAEDEKQLKEGDVTYLVSNLWLNRVISRGAEARQKSKVEPEGEIGPIDNSDIIQQTLTDSAGVEFVQLKRGLVALADYTYFTVDAWTLVVEWYGLTPGSIPIRRVAHNTSPKGSPENIQFEIYPPVFTIHRLYGDHTNIKIPNEIKDMDPAAPVYVLSTSTSCVEFLKTIKTKAGIEHEKKVRLWRVPRLQPAANPIPATSIAATTPPTSEPSSPTGVLMGPETRAPQDSWKLLVDVATFLKLEKGVQRELIGFDDHSANAKYNGSSTLAMNGLAADDNIVLDEKTDGQSDTFVSTYTQGGKANSTTLAGNSSSSYIGPSSQSNSGRNSPALSGPITRGRAQKSGSRKPPGTIGLANLGNTCYMNSALQCVRSVEELTKYFLTGHGKEEINPHNPLGNNGNVARAYGDLLAQFYNDSGSSAVRPVNFKNTIGKYAPSFSGYGQQDSQEFLGFLLDGLQEDLSRVLKKPYIEKPDSTDEMVNNPEAIREMAAKVWDITKQRDDSVIADLFTGMYKSTLVCPSCNKISITFDPFNNLTLQLPIESRWSHQVYYFPLNDKPILVTIDIDKNASIGSLKDFVSKRVGVPADRLFVCEEYKSKFYTFYKDLAVASEKIGTNDHVAVYELEAKPTNWPPRAAKKLQAKSFGNESDAEDEIPPWDDPMAERMLVPVFHRVPNSRGFSGKPAWEVTCTPHFIMLTPDEARSEDMVKRKILEKISTLTTSSQFLDMDVDASVSDCLDPDIVLTTGSDADSSGGSKVVASSVDGDDEIVDVSMKDAAAAPGPLGKFNTRRPKFILPDSHLNPSLQNMFEIGYFGTRKNLINTGWQIVTENKVFPKISSRSPQPQADDGSVSGYEGSRTSSENPEDSVVNSGPAKVTRMNDESESEEDATPKDISRVKVLPVRSRGNKRMARKAKPEQTIFDDDEDSADGGPLVRLGEGLVVDWVPEAWDALFCGDSSDDIRGIPTWQNVPTLEDSELQALKSYRMKRKKNGITLEDCLDEFGKEEILSESDTCGWRRDKLDVLVDFPLTDLDLSSRVIESEDGKQEIYDLFAVDDHWGGLGGGHYTAFAKNYDDQQWYEYNDSSVTKVTDLSRIVSSSAYLLFYRRRSDVPLGGPRFKQILHEYNSSRQSSEDQYSESGEGKGLVGNSSPRGSSSAWFGVGAARPQLNPGSSSGEEMMTINPSDLESGLPPAYEEDEAISLVPSVEKDDSGYSTRPTWGFGGLNSETEGYVLGANSRQIVSGAGSDAGDAGSDVAEHNSSASDSSLIQRKRDLASSEAFDEDFEQAFVPDMTEEQEAASYDLRSEVVEHVHGKVLYRRTLSNGGNVEHFEEVDEPVVEIHVTDNDDLNIE
ncbi:uncharacterized protein L3040_000802 [Drepanopeziza brunnea f. sp. 'multigermtubi']|uniref:uncharacterized protein n=1 Tax=Drepanopeziza brunnea f. sp. 'multigermtubi' TaxID=698441 RepID=UPI00239DBF5E|nr:hypothetical protein L3040_000802 [Drepanopeziza brunnea f. sp. 'multigermtubi']